MTTVSTVFQVCTTSSATVRVWKPDGRNPALRLPAQYQKTAVPAGGELRLKLRINRSPGPFPSTGAPLLTDQTLGDVDFDLAEVGLMPLQ